MQLVRYDVAGSRRARSLPTPAGTPLHFSRRRQIWRYRSTRYMRSFRTRPPTTERVLAPHGPSLCWERKRPRSADGETRKTGTNEQKRVRWATITPGETRVSGFDLDTADPPTLVPAGAIVPAAPVLTRSASSTEQAAPRNPGSELESANQDPRKHSTEQVAPRNPRSELESKRSTGQAAPKNPGSERGSPDQDPRKRYRDNEGTCRHLLAR